MQPIKNLTGKYASRAELILSGDEQALRSARIALTAVNLSVKKDIQRLKNTQPRNPKHAHLLKSQIAEAEAKAVVEFFSDLPDGTISTAPGYYWLCESITGPQYNLSQVKPIINEKARYYQKKAVEEMLKYSRSSFLGVTGCGKSIIISMLVNSLVAAGRRVMVITPSVTLVHQLYATIKSESTEGIKISRCGDGYKPLDGSHVLVSTIQSAMNEVDKYDAVIFDELHVTGAEYFSQVGVATAMAKNVYGMTGSIERQDGMQVIIPAWAGKVVHQYTYKEALQDGFLSPIIHIQHSVNTGMRVWDGMHMLKKYSKHYTSDAMQQYLINAITESNAKGRRTVVLGKTLEPLKMLAAKFNVSIADADFKNPIRQFQRGEIPVLLATSKLIGTGLDIPDISTIIFITNGTSKIEFLQSCGRGSRKAEGKKDCIVLDVYPATAEYEGYASVRRKYSAEAGFKVSVTGKKVSKNIEEEDFSL